MAEEDFDQAVLEEQEKVRAREAKEREAAEARVCNEPVTVQVGPMAAIDLRCQTTRGGHGDSHQVGRYFGTVLMTAKWPGGYRGV